MMPTSVKIHNEDLKAFNTCDIPTKTMNAHGGCYEVCLYILTNIRAVTGEEFLPLGVMSVIKASNYLMKFNKKLL